jgi:hypothetical protein
VHSNKELKLASKLGEEDQETWKECEAYYLWIANERYGDTKPALHATRVLLTLFVRHSAIEKVNTLQRSFDSL